MSIRDLHERLVVVLAQSQPNTHPETGSNEVLAKNAFSPFNMLGISKTKLEKVGNSEALGDIYLFSGGKSQDKDLFLYSAQLNTYGRVGKASLEDVVLKAIRANKLSSIEDTLINGLTQEDEVSAYVPKEITKIIKKISSKYSKNDLVVFYFETGGVRVFIEKDSAIIGIFYPARIDNRIIGKYLHHREVKPLKNGVWMLLGKNNIFDEDREWGATLRFTEETPQKIFLPNKHITIKGSSILKMLKFVGNAVDTNNSKDALNYLMIEVKDGQGKLVGTDTRRLAVSNEFDVSGADGKYHIHGTHLQDNPKSIRLSEKVTEVEYLDHTYTQQLKHDPMFPEYQRIIPQNMTNSFEVETKELKGIKDKVVFMIKDNQVYIQSIKDSDDFIETDLSTMKPLKTISMRASDAYVVLDAKFIKDAISGSDEVTISINDKNSPILVDGNQGLTVMMPIVHKTVAEEHEDEMKRQDKEYEKNVKEAERKEREKIEKIEEQERLKEEDGIAHDYLIQLTPMERGRARKLLHRNIRYNSEVTSTIEYIEQRLKDGYRGEQKEWQEYSNKLARRVDKKKWVLTNGDSFIESTKTEAQLLNYLGRTKS